MESGNRIRTLRLAKGLTQDGLAAEMGGVITKQALSKYEKGKARPTSAVATRLAAALGVKTVHLYSEPEYRVEFVAYRRKARMPVSEREHLESWATVQLQERVRLQERLEGSQQGVIGLHELAVSSHEDADQAATQLRHAWNLGLDPIPSVMDTLETQRVHVLDADVSERFDGISAVVKNSDGETVAAGVVSRAGARGERQRMNLAHELGHLVLRMEGDLDEESAAKRFASAFLVPDEAMRRELGPRRSFVSTEELMVLKRRYGASMQALVMRAASLGIVSDEFKSDWFRTISGRGWRKDEPGPLPPEEPQRWKQLVARGFAEGLVTRSEACRWLDLPEGPDRGLDRRAPLRLPVAQRRALLAAQAEDLVGHYEPGAAGAEWVDDFADEDVLDDY